MSKSISKKNKRNKTESKHGITFTSPINQYEYEGRDFDRMYHALLGRYIGWLSPDAWLLSMIDWLTYLIISPAKLSNLNLNALNKLLDFFVYSLQSATNKTCKPCISVRQTDQRFQNPLWNQPPYNLYSQLFLLTEQWWYEATTNIEGVSKHHQHLINFIARQILDVLSPSNAPWLNPEVTEVALRKQGMNFIQGYLNYLEDIARNLNNKPPVGHEAFKVGVDLAVTPGKVVYRNDLMELIQYSPTTQQVYAEPILIIPAWIMKYYILDLSPHNSMVKYLVDQGHTVFMISWKNPTSTDRDLGLSDYAKLGVMDALDTINIILPQQKVHTVGYCIGGTLLMIAAASMAAKGDERLKTITLFAAQIDFTRAGELLLFIDTNQIEYIKDMMWEKGYLDGAQMAGAFSMLHAVNLIWSRVIRQYLMGERQPMTDLMAWDYDTTRMPYKMHTEYLEGLFLNNDLVEGRFKLFDKNVSLADISAPIFVVSTLKDHVAPWESVYMVHHFVNSDITFVLANAGHNTGIVNEPGQPGRTFQMLAHKQSDKHLSTEAWQQQAAHYEGSWWPAWEHWIATQSGNKVNPPEFANPKKGLPILCDAPGLYIFQK